MCCLGVAVWLTLIGVKLLQADKVSRLKRVYQMIVLAAALWAISVVAISLITDQKFLFVPVQGQPDGETIEQRGEVLRLTLFLQFAYFALLHVFADSRKVSAGHVLVTTMSCITFIGLVKIFTSGSLSRDAAYVVAFGVAALAIFLGSRPRVRRYFSKRS